MKLKKLESQRESLLRLSDLQRRNMAQAALALRQSASYAGSVVKAHPVMSAAGVIAAGWAANRLAKVGTAVWLAKRGWGLLQSVLNRRHNGRAEFAT